MKNLSKLIVNINSKISTALKLIESNETGALIVINENKKVEGVLTDGDIRRSLLKGLKMSDKVRLATNKNYIFATEKTSSDYILKALDLNKKIIPLINSKKVLLDAYTKDNFIIKKQLKFLIHSRAPGRISFSGGGSDLTKYIIDKNIAVLNVSINLYSYCTLNLKENENIIIISSNIPKVKKYKNLEDFLKKNDEFNLVRAAIRLIRPTYGFELILSADFEIGSGLGGSTAMLASIFGCFNDLRINKWNRYELSELCFQSERIVFNQKGGWQDQYGTIFGGFKLIEFSKNKNIVNQLNLPSSTINSLETCINLVDTNKFHDSGLIHSKIKLPNKTNELKSYISEMYKNVYKIRDSLLFSDFKSFNNLINDNWKFKKKISGKISTKKIDNLIASGLKNGSISSRLLGSGKGGFIMFFVDPQKIHNFNNWIKKNKLKSKKIKFDNSGLEVWRTFEK